jgi:predicted transcriptional regulator
MTKNPDSHLTRREQQIMEIIHKSSEASVADIVESMPDPVADSAVRVFLKTLMKKGRVRRRKDGRRFFYSAIGSRRTEGRSALRRILGTFFESSFADAVSSHLSDPSVKLQDGELERMARLIEEARSRDS